MVMEAVRLTEKPVDVEVIDLRRVDSHKKILTDELSWKNEALCQTNPDLWFPAKGEAGTAAKMICRQCPVKEPCLDLAIQNGESFGVWGGMGARERRALAKKRGLES